MDDDLFLVQLARDQDALITARRNGVAPLREWRMRRDMYAEYKRDPRVIAAREAERLAVEALRQGKELERLEQVEAEALPGVAERVIQEREAWEATQTRPSAWRRLGSWLRGLIPR